MKRILSVLLVLCLLTAVLPAWAEEAQEEEGYLAVVANPSLADRLNLRSKPDTESETLGRFYSGTPVYVRRTLKDGKGREWAEVDMMANFEAGVHLHGYMLREYLMDMNANFEAPQLFYKAVPQSKNVQLLEEPRNNAAVNTSAGDILYILGDIGDDWRLAATKRGVGGVVGYVRAARLKQQWMDVPCAYLIPADGSEKVTVYADKELKKPLAWLYSGAAVQVTDCSRGGGWAAVESYGVLPELAEKWQADIVGYVRQEDLSVFIQPWQVEMKMRAGIALEDIETEESGVIIPRGASVTVTGEMDGRYQIVYGDAANMWFQEMMAPERQIRLTERGASNGGPDRLGYGWLQMEYDGEEGYKLGSPIAVMPGGQEWAYPTFISLVEIYGEVERNGKEYWQVRNNDHPCFYVEKEKCLCRMDGAGDNYLAPAHGAGTWTADEQDQGLWYLTVPSGAEAVLTLKRLGSETELFPVEADCGEVHYTFDLEKGTKVTLEGEGFMRPLAGKDIPELVPACPPNYRDTETVFEGSGRFFCDAQIPDQSVYFTLEILPMDGYDDCWYAVTDLFTRVGEDGALISGGKRTVYFAEEKEITEQMDESMPLVEREEGGAEYFEVPGSFLEVHHCVVNVFFGNG